MELTTSWLEEGLEQGKKEEATALITRLLRRRLGGLAEAQENQLRSLSVSQLEDLGEALLDFTRSAELDTWLEGNISRE